MQILEYRSIEGCRGSNHRPVFASFNIEIRHWFVPQELPAISENLRKTIVKFKAIRVVLDEPLGVWSIFLSFFSTYLDTYPIPIQASTISGREIEFNVEKTHAIGFINVSTAALRDQRLVVLLNKRNDERASEVLGVASTSLERLIGDFHSSGASKQKVKRMSGFEAPLELNSRVIGKVSGLWKFKVLPPH